MCEVISGLQTLLSNSCNSLSYSISLLTHFNVSVALILTQKVCHLTSAFLVPQKPDEEFVLELLIWGGGGNSLATWPITHQTPLTPLSTKPSPCMDPCALFLVEPSHTPWLKTQQHHSASFCLPYLGPLTATRGSQYQSGINTHPKWRYFNSCNPPVL